MALSSNGLGDQVVLISLNLELGRESIHEYLERFLAVRYIAHRKGSDCLCCLQASPRHHVPLSRSRR